MIQAVGEPAEQDTAKSQPLGWRTEGKSARLAKGMPSVSPTGLKGVRNSSRVERNAENFGLDEEMLRAKD